MVKLRDVHKDDNDGTYALEDSRKILVKRERSFLGNTFPQDRREQNRNQQKRADEQSDLALMPDLYIQTALLERLSGFGNAVFNTVSAAINDNSIPKMSISIAFWFVKGQLSAEQVAVITLLFAV